MLSTPAKLFRHLKSLWQILVWKITNIIQTWLKLSELCYVCVIHFWDLHAVFINLSSIHITIPMFFTIFSLVKHLSFSDVSQVFLYLAACFYSVFFVIYLIGLFWIHGSTQKKNRNWFTHLKKSKCLAFYEKYTCHPVLLSFWYGHNHWFTKHFS